MPDTQIYYPDHWYYDQTNLIGCIVPHCDFITPSESVVTQWRQMHDHCIDTPGPEHKLLDKILGQTQCAIDQCNHISFEGYTGLGLRQLFLHEKDEHGSTEMSNISSFVRLARESRIRYGRHRNPVPDCEKLAFHRMVDKILALPAATIDLIFRKSGYHDPEQKSLQNLERLLTDDPSITPGDRPPYWWPVRAEEFLWRSDPDTRDPKDPHWKMLWTHLRQDYAAGRI